MRNKHPASKSNSGRRNQSAAVLAASTKLAASVEATLAAAEIKVAALEKQIAATTIRIVSQRILSVPSRSEFAAAYSEGLDGPPMRLTRVNYAVILLFDSESCGNGVEESTDLLSDAQVEKIAGVFDSITTRTSATVISHRVCAALCRVALGQVCLTYNAASSEIPVDVIYDALLAHRKMPGGPVEPALKRSSPLVNTVRKAPDNAWPDFAITTHPDGPITVIRLIDESDRHLFAPSGI